MTTLLHPAPVPAPPDLERVVLARVVLPVDGLALPLHVDGADPDTPTSAQVLDRRRVRVPAGARASFATWSSAFPAGWWARSTDVRTVHLDVELTGPGRVELFRSDAAGRVTALPGRSAGLDDPAGGWVWFDVVAGAADVVLERAQWCADLPPLPQGPGTVTLAITTFDRPASALDVLRRLADEPDALAIVDEVLVVDQGRDRMSAQAGFAQVAQRLDGRLRVLEQANLGGSGGFARGMLEALRAGRSRHVLLLDDDIRLEPEGVLRAVAFADRCRTPTLVAGAMLDLHAPTVLHTPGERIDRRRWLWETVPPGEPDHDLARAGLRSTPWLHTVLDVDYGGWWSCLVPTEALRRVGLALPLFLKWDDVEHALRAGRAGFPTVALPGAGVWHEPWTGKADTLDWQAYYHHRNRLVAALLHAPSRRPLALLAESLEFTLVPLVSMRYAVVALRLRAMEDLLRGPHDLHASLGTRLAEVRALRASHADGRPATPTGPTSPPTPVLRPRSRRRAVSRLGWEVLRTTVRTAPDGPPRTAFPAVQATLWPLSRVDSAWVSTVAGTTSEHRRDARTATGLLARTLVLHARTVLRWPRLRTAYRAALPDLVSHVTWSRTLGLTGDTPQRG